MISATAISAELATGSATGSAACAQQPQVTQVGGHDRSSRPGSSYVVHGSAWIKADMPDALNVSKPTMIARASRGTFQV